MIVNKKIFSDQPIDSDIKRYEDITKLTKGQGEDYTIGCLLDYEIIKNHYRWLDADLKVIQQVEFVGQWKNLNDGIVDNKFIFVLKTLEKIIEMKQKLLQGSVTVL